MASTSLQWTRRGVVTCYYAILLMAVLLILVNILPRFWNAGYKDVFPLIGFVHKRATGPFYERIGPFYERVVSVGWLRNRIREAIARDRSPITVDYA